MQELSTPSHLVMSEPKQNQQTLSSESQVDKNRIKLKNKTLDSGCWNHHHGSSGGRDSSQDPDIASTEALGRHLSSNARSHPRAELKQATPTTVPDVQDKDAKRASHVSNHVQNHTSGGRDEGNPHDATPSTNSKRPRTKEGGVASDQEDAWTEHISSSGRTYYYNKRLDKSQWEKPKGLLKKAKSDSTPSKKSVSSTPLTTPASSSSSSSHHHHYHHHHHHHRDSSHTSTGHTHHREGSHAHRDSGGGGGSSNSSSRHRDTGDKGRSHRDRDRGSGSGGRGLKEGGDRHHGSSRGKSSRDSHRHSSKSRSHSGSSSPPSRHGGGVARTPSAAKSASSSGRNHGNTGGGGGGGGGGGERVTPSHPVVVSPAGSTPKGVGGIQLISPTTPSSSSVGVGGTAATLPGSIVATATTPVTTLCHTLTKQLIDHTSILVQQQHHQLKLMQGATDITTPTSVVMSTPTLTSQDLGTPVTPYAQMQSLARKRLSLTPQGAQQAPPTSYSQPLLQQQQQQGSLPSSPQLQGVAYHSPHHAPSQGVGGGGGVVMASPQPAAVDSTGLHPLQRALLIQQKIQQAPPTAIPPHMTANAIPQGGGVASNSPGNVAQSPTHLGATPPTYAPTPPPNVIQPLTPHQQNVFAMPMGGAPTTFDPSVLVGVPTQQQVLSSKALQLPMSKLAYLSQSSELLQFPDHSSLDRPGSVGVAGGSQVNMEGVDRELALLWLRHSEHLAKQIQQGRFETLKRRTVDGFFVSGQLTKRHLTLAAAEIKTASRNQRLRQLQALLQELEKR